MFDGALFVYVPNRSIVRPVQISATDILSHYRKL